MEDKNMSEKKELNELELERVAGGKIPDSALYFFLGYTWKQIENAVVTSGFLDAASQAGHETAANAARNVIDNQDIDTTDSTIFAYFVELKEFANTNPTQWVNALAVIEAIEKLGKSFGLI